MSQQSKVAEAVSSVMGGYQEEIVNRVLNILKEEEKDWDDNADEAKEQSVGSNEQTDIEDDDDDEDIVLNPNIVGNIGLEHLQAIVGIIVAGMDMGIFDGDYANDLIDSIIEFQDNDDIVAFINGVKDEYHFDCVAKSSKSKQKADKKEPTVEKQDKDSDEKAKRVEITLDELKEMVAKRLDEILSSVDDDDDDDEQPQPKVEHRKNRETQRQRSKSPVKRKVTYIPMDDFMPLHDFLFRNIFRR